MTHSTKCMIQMLTLVLLPQSWIVGQTKLVHLPFSEGNGTTTANVGTLGGVGTFEQQAGLPVFSTNVPSGPFAPSGNTSSTDFGTIDEPDDGGRGIDFSEDTAIPTVGMSAFTITGWLNLRQDNIGCGGNRILTTWNGNFADGGGFDLVHESNGRLRFSVNEAPDFPGPGPYSSPDSVTIDPEAAASNWVFFAVTYDAADLANDSDGVVSYYFGNGSTLAAKDTVTNYDKGAIGRHSNESEPILTVGNFNANVGARYELGPRGATCASRVLRGLADDLRLYTGVLSMDQIRAAQMRRTGPSGDFNGNGTLDAMDIDALSAEVIRGTNAVAFDVTGDGRVNEADRTEWVTKLRKTWFGDANLNGEFNSGDFVSVFIAGKYESNQPASWAEGDWNGDALFTSSDFVAAFIGGGYEKGPRAAVAAVPEPASSHLILLGGLILCKCRRVFFRMFRSPEVV